MTELIKRLDESVAYIKSKININPTVGIILGSGLGSFVDQIEDKVEIPYSDIPSFLGTTVKGHAGQLVVGKINGVEVAVMQGRNHAYEGHSQQEVVYPVRTLGRLGVKKLILTNAAGGINTEFYPSQLVLIKDHINFMGTNPLIGENEDALGTRFPDMTYAWSPELRKLAQETAKEMQYKLDEGVYLAVMGPTYETPSEIKMFRTLGADMVGMSTVPENIAGNHMGMEILGISCITNMGAGIEKEKLDHSHVKDTANSVIDTFKSLLTNIVKKM